MSRAVAEAIFQRKGLINSTIISAKRTADTDTMIINGAQTAPG
jgi:hypothetical protein